MMVKNKKIKEDRYTRPDNFKDVFGLKNDKFEERTSEFWNDIDGIISLLNKTDDKKTNTTIESPQVTQYLLWRILNEIKLLKLPRKKGE